MEEQYPASGLRVEILQYTQRRRGLLPRECTDQPVQFIYSRLLIAEMGCFSGPSISF